MKRLICVIPLLVLACGDSTSTTTTPPVQPTLSPDQFKLFPVTGQDVAASPKDIVWTNIGQQQLTFTSIQFVDNDAGAFCVSPPTPCSTTASDANQTANYLKNVALTVTFTPPSAPAVFVARLVGMNDSVNLPETYVELVGPATTVPPIAAATVFPLETTITVNEETDTILARIINVGQDQLEIIGYTLTPDDGTFKFLEGTENPTPQVPVNLQQGATKTVQFVYDPPGAGPHTATFDITSNPGTTVTSFTLNSPP